MKKLLIPLSLLLLPTTIIQAADVQHMNITWGNFNWGASVRQGKRPHLEDTFAMKTLGPNLLFFGLYDGHAGNKAAQVAALGSDKTYALHDYIAAFLGKQHIPHLSCHDIHPMFDQPTEAKLKKAYEIFDREFLKSGDDSGTTAVTALFEGNKLYLAWAGDSRAILVNQDGTLSQEGQTIDHKPNKSEEKARIEGTGGKVEVWGVPRAPGGLAVSRSLGDRNVKNLKKGIIATPEVKEIKMLAHHSFLILASDGVWDVLSNEEAAKIVKTELEKIAPLAHNRTFYEGTFKIHEEAGSDDNVIRAARALRDAAYNRGSTDNISVIVIHFDVKQTTQPKEDQMGLLQQIDGAKEILSHKVELQSYLGRMHSILGSHYRQTHIRIFLNKLEDINRSRGDELVTYFDQKVKLRFILSPVIAKAQKQLYALRNK